MNTSQINVASTLAAHPRFEWEPGMQAYNRPCESGRMWFRLAGYSIHDGGEFWIWTPNAHPGDRKATRKEIATFIPNLDDPATIGCLLSAARRAWNTQCVWTEPPTYDHPRWDVIVDVERVESADTEGEALALAIMHAPTAD